MEKHANEAPKLHDRLIWLTRTASIIALLIVTQAVTAPLGNTLITGSAVNALLVLSVLLCGPSSGMYVALLSPLFARLLGIGPQLWALLPFISVGNAALVACWWVITAKTKKRQSGYIAALVTAAVIKFAVLYLGVSKLAVPYLLNLPEKQAGIISGMFALPQLLTALIGGAIALMIYSVIKAAVRGR